MNFSKSEIKQLCFVCEVPKYDVESFVANDGGVIGVCEDCDTEDFECGLSFDLGLVRESEVI
tara:strand:+ start:1784 stop:1969 length:186 start_codon:yes stop_codon:yes gene_type:complete